MSVTVGLFEAKTHLSELVNQVSEEGTEIVITRRGTAVARIVPMDSESPVEAALARLLAAREGSTPGGGSLRDLIEEGRRW